MVDIIETIPEFVVGCIGQYSKIHIEFEYSDIDIVFKTYPTHIPDDRIE